MEVIILNGVSYLLYDAPPEINKPYVFKTNPEDEWTLGKKWVNLPTTGNKQLLDVLNPWMIRKYVLLLK